MTTPIAAIARVPTANGSKHLQQLCKHWSHNLQVAFTPDHGTVTFPREGRSGSFPRDGLATFDAEADALVVRVDASTGEQLEALQDVVARHLDRFAFREAPLAFDWRQVDEDAGVRA